MRAVLMTDPTGVSSRVTSLQVMKVDVEVQTLQPIETRRERELSTRRHDAKSHADVRVVRWVVEVGRAHNHKHKSTRQIVSDLGKKLVENCQLALQLIIVATSLDSDLTVISSILRPRVGVE